MKPSGTAPANRRGLAAATAFGCSIAVALAAACSAPVNHSAPDGRSSAMPAGTHTGAACPAASRLVVHVVDGDTIDVQQDTHTVRVRVLGINAPELAHGGQAAECYSLDATARARDLLLGKPVALISDPTQPQLDRYQRPLRYVEIAGRDLGHLLIEGGYAREYHLRTQGQTQRTPSYLAAQNQAKNQRVGLWGACPSPDIGS